jgi:hypothetical protein
MRRIIEVPAKQRHLVSESGAHAETLMMRRGDDLMTRKRKLTEQASVVLEELPRGAEELTSAEAEATKGGLIYTPSMAAGVAAAVGQASAAEGCIEEGCIWFSDDWRAPDSW